MSGASSDLRIGLVGCGRLAERGYVRALEEVDGGRLAAVADPVPERCAHVAPDVPAFASAAQMLAGADVDALVLASPAAAHLEDAELAASAGLRTLIEKPPAETLADAVLLARLVPAPRFSFNRRFVPEIERLREAAAGASAVDLHLTLRTRRSSWRAFAVRDDALLSLGPHLVDLVRWIGGAEIASVRADVLPERARLELVLADGRGHAIVECASNRPYRERVAVAAPSGPLGTYAAGGVRAWARAAGGVHPLVPSLRRQLAAFLRVVRGEGELDLASAVDGVAVMAVLEAGRASSARRARVPVPAPGVIVHDAVG